MALTIRTAPFGKQPAGYFDIAPPVRPLLFWEPFAKRLRVFASGRMIADSRRVVALHETGKMMRLCAPWADVWREVITAGGEVAGGRLGPLRAWSVGAGGPIAQSINTPPEGAAALKDHVIFDVEKADAWYLEDDLGYAHPRDPYHRFDVHRSSRYVVVRAGDTLVGAGALDATDEVIAVADRLGAGCATALLGKMALPSDLPWNTECIGLLGTKPSSKMMEECDTLLMVGSGFPWAEFLPKEGKARGVQVDIKPEMLSIRYPMEVNLSGDSKETLAALLPLLEQKSDLAWRETISKWKKE